MSQELIHLNVSYGTSRRGIPGPLSFRRWVGAALHEAQHQQQVELSIRVVDADEGRTLNRQYRHKDYATNVLSFPAELPVELDLPLLGDLAICAPIVLQEATDQNKPLKDHWAHMTIHGLLHLLGYDHQVDAEADVMETLEIRILAIFGIANPYIVK